MKFLIQKNLFKKVDLDNIRSLLEKYPTDYVDLIPFTNHIDVNGNEDYIPYGSTLFTMIANSQYKWSGLHFSLDTFNYEASLENRNDMLNDNVMRLDDAIHFLASNDPKKDIFVRPSADLKQFSGGVFTAQECHDWFKDMMECATSGSYKLDPDTKVVVSLPKVIDKEVRCFIVGGEVVSSSIYRQNGSLLYKRCFESVFQQIADSWLPDDCCVMDLAYTSNGIKVIEFNCINSSGMYDCDKDKIFKSLWDYHNKG